MSIKIFISFILLSLLFGCKSQLATNQTEGKPKGYEDVLAILQYSDDAVPARPNLHPVSATFNREAIIPPQCYTKTEAKFNPCYVCHQDKIPGRENTMHDGELQEAYSFSDLGMKNHWNNLFEDRSERVNQISDEEIRTWIDQDNYSELAGRLREEGFKGWIPDLENLQYGADAFDDEGFAKDGTNWIAYNYKPFPSTFWPTNGSTDDVMIRLSEPYRTTQDGNFSRDVYKANLAILEANMKGLDKIDSLPISEKEVGVDLNGDGKLSVVESISKLDSYVGAAKEYYLETFIFPQDTEFLHTVRYVGISDKGEITYSKRMKEVRYMRKYRAYPKFVVEQYYIEEGYEKEAGNLPGYNNLGQLGLDNGFGWAIQGFIENKNGRLRENSYEETLFCMGCHGSIGATIDKTFSFARKVDGAKGWKYIDLKGMPDAPSHGDSMGEIARYLSRIGGGGEFRNNPEMESRWFNDDGSIKHEKIAASDVYTLITPSVERALELNKAYKAIVEEQDFLFGRDATVKPPKNVFDRIDNETTETLDKKFQYSWDIRLNWNVN